jgi:hypothetical protein
MFKIATLLKNKEDNSLDVCVEKEDFEIKRFAQTQIANTKEKNIIGIICFKDNRNSEGIAFDFAETYPHEIIGEDHDGKYYFVRYKPEFEATIPMCFVDYFSKRT